MSDDHVQSMNTCFLHFPFFYTDRPLNIQALAYDEISHLQRIYQHRSSHRFLLYGSGCASRAHMVTLCVGHAKIQDCRICKPTQKTTDRPAHQQIKTGKNDLFVHLAIHIHGDMLETVIRVPHRLHANARCLAAYKTVGAIEPQRRSDTTALDIDAYHGIIAAHMAGTKCAVSILVSRKQFVPVRWAAMTHPQ